MTHHDRTQPPRAAYQRRLRGTSVFGQEPDRAGFDHPLALEITADDLLTDLDSGYLAWRESNQPETDPAAGPAKAA